MGLSHVDERTGGGGGMNPVIPMWDDLTSEERTEIVESWEMWSCPHRCGGDAIHFYNDLRVILLQGEKRYLQATMEGPPE